MDDGGLRPQGCPGGAVFCSFTTNPPTIYVSFFDKGRRLANHWVALRGAASLHPRALALGCERSEQPDRRLSYNVP